MKSGLEELLKLSTERYVPPYLIALVYNGLGRRDEALAWLERGYQEHDFSLVFLEVAPWFESVRGDPRFQQLLGRMQLPERSTR